MENPKKEKDLLLLYKLYLQAAHYAKEYGDKYGDLIIMRKLEEEIPEGARIKKEEDDNKPKRR